MFGCNDVMVCGCSNVTVFGCSNVMVLAVVTLWSLRPALCMTGAAVTLTAALIRDFKGRFSSEGLILKVHG